MKKTQTQYELICRIIDNGLSPNITNISDYKLKLMIAFYDIFSDISYKIGQHILSYCKNKILSEDK